MIYDKLDNLALYSPLLAKAARVIASLSANTPCGRIAIDGETMFASVEECETKLPDASLFESHIKYVDVHSCLTGAECLHFCNLGDCTLVNSNEDGDCSFHNAIGNRYNALVAFPGEAVVFFPQDAHRPKMRAHAGKECIKKVVVKIRAEQIQLFTVKLP